jgi:hypothetical protein
MHRQRSGPGGGGGAGGGGGGLAAEVAARTELAEGGGTIFMPPCLLCITKNCTWLAQIVGQL